MSRPTRTRQIKGESMVGTRHVVTVGEWIHGGHAVARTDAEQRVIFVHHALTGERVVVEVTEGGSKDRFWRGDAVEIIEPAAARVAAPCPVSGPGGCGGCDFQHVEVAQQRTIKQHVVEEQFRRLAGLDVEVSVGEVDGDEAGLRWRTRADLHELPDGRLGMYRHRSHELIPVSDCLINRAGAAERDQEEQIERVHAAGSVLDFTVPVGAFWQVHQSAPRVLVEAVFTALQPQPGESVLDLYAGVGLFSRFLGEAVGEQGTVHAVEANRVAAAAAQTANLRGPQFAVTRGATERVLGTAIEPRVDLVVLDPPREGAKRTVVERIAQRQPRAVAYVACDPAALARDTAYFAESGYVLQSVQAFDLFPMTHHVECVALLAKDARG